MLFDNIHFVSKEKRKKKCLREWINIQGCAAFVALDDRYQIVGFGQRCQAIQAKYHLIGPLCGHDIITACR
ncbi:hypothetical protein LSH36_186g04031 [Paralvinella palmiformis]|uniref:Uncharacterized protein n=1 Tax=Paralvinella palmiformis TaxID=53620 RepID=A0AAD9N7D1_9ANNE|nr:hypothetical protein LSH36_186g04031 [Paralvinella palmiformis]